MLKEYNTIREIVGPLALVEGVEGVKYNELVEIRQENGEIRAGKVLEINRDKALVQLFEPSQGIKMATGDIIGILNADDVLTTDDTLAHIAEAFKSGGVWSGGVSERVDCVYADIRFVTRQDAASPSLEAVGALRNAKTVRYCSAAKWRPWMFRFAAMVPHPSFYVRRECFERLGGYSLDYRICADFELELRYLYLAKLKAAYLPECVVVMRMGGMSTAGWRSNIVINREDLRALRSHGIWSCLPLIYLKYLFKIWGFVFRGQ